MMRIVALVCALSMGPASVQQAEKAWAEERFSDAAAAYAEAYAETGDIAYLYARAQAEQRSGDCKQAIETYETFIATQPKQDAIAAANAEIEACRELLPEPEPEPEPAPPQAEPPPPVVSEPAAVDEEPGRPWHRDPAGASLLGVGLVGVGVGTALAITAQVTQSNAERADDVVDYGDKNDRAVALSRASIPVLAVGAALVIGGIIRYAVVGARQSNRGRDVARLVVRF